MTDWQIIFWPNGYRGVYEVRRRATGEIVASPLAAAPGRGTVRLAEGAYYLSTNHGANFAFSVLGNGDVDCTGTIGLARKSAGEIDFQTCVVTIDPGRFPGTFEVFAVEPPGLAGERQVTLLKGVQSAEWDGGYIGRIAHGNGMFFNVDEHGDVGLNSHYTGAAVTASQTLRLKSVEVDVTPVNYDAPWTMAGAEAKLRKGPRRLTLVPHVRGYLLTTQAGNSGVFDLDADGCPSVPDLRIQDGGLQRVFHLARVAPPHPSG